MGQGNNVAHDPNVQRPNTSALAQSVIPILLGLLLSTALFGAWMVRAAPLEPSWARGLLRLDGLTACFSVLTLAIALAAPQPSAFSPQPSAFSPQPSFFVPIILCAAYLTTQLAVLGAGLLLAALLLGLRRWESWLAALLAAGGLILIALRAGTWRYAVPDAGLGLNSLSFGLILCAVLLAGGVPSLVYGRTPRPFLLLATGLVYTFYRLFSLGPWNLGWMLAALLLGAAVALGAGWRAALHADAGLAGWLAIFQFGMAIVGGGLASGAGLALGACALLALALQQAALGQGSWFRVQDSAAPAARAPLPARSLWLVSGAVPLTVPFVAGWLGVAGAMAGGITVLAVVLWASLLLAAAGVARVAEAGREDQGPPGHADDGRWTTDDDQRPVISDQRLSSMLPRPSAIGYRLSAISIAAVLSLVLGITTPALFALLVQPMVDQLQGGLTPFGEVTLWPWAGLLALNAARQPVATLPSLALAVLMLILTALAWLVTQFVALRRRQGPGEL